ncbi:MAG: 1-deoxy-D-xylulose-5-phosphate synthase, partial [Candidatus Hydrogenedentes bacterium]|nr:1-deoxy-D-xylulose-5-phosphate synthase [Candidatus Hydrogenedentota bacterium]
SIGGTQEPIRRGVGELLREGCDGAIVAIGSMVGPSLEAARILENQGIDVAVVDARFAKPLDTSLLRQLFSDVRAILTVEEHVLDGGFGSAVMEFAEREGLLRKVALRGLGLPSAFVEHGARAGLLDLCGLNAATIARQTKSLIQDPVEARHD